jgi:DNA-directed RNA polymerase specialized sigma24 family protein
MASQGVAFTGLSERERSNATPLLKLAEGDRVEMRVRRRDGQEQAVTLPPAAARIVETLIAQLLRGERVTVLTEDQELSPTEAAAILGVSRPLVLLRMDRGDLPFRYVDPKLGASCF